MERSSLGVDVHDHIRSAREGLMRINSMLVLGLNTRMRLGMPLGRYTGMTDLRLVSIGLMWYMKLILPPFGILAMGHCLTIQSRVVRRCSIWRRLGRRVGRRSLHHRMTMMMWVVIRMVRGWSGNIAGRLRMRVKLWMVLLYRGDVRRLVRVRIGGMVAQVTQWRHWLGALYRRRMLLHCRLWIGLLLRVRV